MKPRSGRLGLPRNAFATVLPLLVTATAMAPQQGVRGIAAAQELSTELERPGAALPASHVRSEASLLVLGKALFWDEQVGSDGRIACATCHFAAGADHRLVDTVHPGENGVLEAVAAGAPLTRASFPILSDDVVGSVGVASGEFRGVRPGDAEEARDTDRSARRRVTARNAPSVINAALAEVLFWDGRVRGDFEAGCASSTDVGLWAETDEGVRIERVSIAGGALAAQGLHPVLDEVEMSYTGRGAADLGRKLLPLRALAGQEVHPEDGVLGGHRASTGTGLESTYRDLVEAAFEEHLWASETLFDGEGRVIGTGEPQDADEHSLAEVNFGYFLGIALLAYERTLISDDSRFDRALRGELRLTEDEAAGFDLFVGKGCCSPCHVPPEFSAASRRESDHPLAFVNTGLRPIEEDAGRGGGRFKTPSLRNVALTGPYFHNGSRATLRQVVDFYDLGGDYASEETDIQVQPIGLTEEEKSQLVLFLMSLTDDRVLHRAAPFDGPSLSPPNGVPIPPTGRSGGAPIATFLGLSPLEQ